LRGLQNRVPGLPERNFGGVLLSVMVQGLRLTGARLGPKMQVLSIKAAVLFSKLPNKT